MGTYVSDRELAPERLVRRARLGHELLARAPSAVHRHPQVRRARVDLHRQGLFRRADLDGPVVLDVEPTGDGIRERLDGRAGRCDRDGHDGGGREGVG